MGFISTVDLLLVMLQFTKKMDPHLSDTCIFKYIVHAMLCKVKTETVFLMKLVPLNLFSISQFQFDRRTISGCSVTSGDVFNTRTSNRGLYIILHKIVQSVFLTVYLNKLV